jgi:leucyl/phenylalanyl-tRNA--protein transferase
MFHTETNASKVALYALMSILKVNDIDWIDTQMVTPVIASMGGKSITRDNFLVELNKTIHEPITRDEIFNFNFSELNPLFC